MWHARLVTGEILSFGRTIRSDVGIGKPWSCGQGSQNTTSVHVYLPGSCKHQLLAICFLVVCRIPTAFYSCWFC